MLDALKYTDLSVYLQALLTRFRHITDAIIQNGKSFLYVDRYER
jgi:hypothetical protein